MNERAKGAAKLLDRLRREKGFLHLINDLQNVITGFRFEGGYVSQRNEDEVLQFLDGLARTLKEQFDLEEGVVFPYADRHVPQVKTLSVIMRSEHENVLNNLNKFKEAVRDLCKKRGQKAGCERIQKVRETGTYLIYLVRDRLIAKNDLFYKMLFDFLTQEEQKDLAGRVVEWRQCLQISGQREIQGRNLETKVNRSEPSIKRRMRRQGRV